LTRQWLYLRHRSFFGIEPKRRFRAMAIQLDNTKRGPRRSMRTLELLGFELFMLAPAGFWEGETDGRNKSSR
jgi:hypothetical protein